MGKSGPVNCFGSQLPAFISLCAGVQSRGTQNRPGLPRGLPCHNTGREGCRPGGTKAGFRPEGRRVLREGFLEEVTLGSSLEGPGAVGWIKTWRRISLLDRRAEVHRAEDARCIQETCGRRLAETAERSGSVRSCGRLGIILREIQTSLGESGFFFFFFFWTEGGKIP